MKALEPWKEDVNKVGKQVKGDSAVLLDASHGACFTGECNVGAMLTQAMINEVSSLISNLQISLRFFSQKNFIPKEPTVRLGVGATAPKDFFFF